MSGVGGDGASEGTVVNMGFSSAPQLPSRLLGYVTMRYIEPSSYYLGT